jgi:hypothetical protein
MGLQEVSSILWRERQLLELLLFRLESEQLLLAAGRTRWLALATQEVDRALQAIRQTELIRAAEVEALAAELGLGPGPSLAGLVQAVPKPWDGVFDDHRRAFIGLTNEITTLAEANRDLLHRGYVAVRELLARLADEPGETYSPTGAPARTAGPTIPRLLDEAM